MNALGAVMMTAGPQARPQLGALNTTGGLLQEELITVPTKLSPMLTTNNHPNPKSISHQAHTQRVQPSQPVKKGQPMARAAAPAWSAAAAAAASDRPAGS